MVKKLPDKETGCINSKKLLKIMTLSLVFTLAFTVVSTAETLPRPELVTMEVKSDNLSTTLLRLKDVAQVQILFNEDALGNVKSRDVVLRDATVVEALARILDGTGFESKEINGVYVIGHRAAQQPEALRPVLAGIITAMDGTPLPGVSVLNLTRGTGASSDATGHYRLNIEVGDRVRFSFIGYRPQEFIADAVFLQNNPNGLNVSMEEDVTQIESVAVIGYGATQKIKDATGSIAHVGERELETAPMGATVQSMLQGRAAGVNVQIQSASPTSPISVIIRGQSSLTGNNQPLWVIDGIPEYNTGVDGTVSNVLYSLNLNDVESLDILKDASATAIYGSRAANGVIVVTTKSGREGRKPTVEFSSRIGVQMMNMNGFDFFDAPDYIDFTRKAMRKELLNRGVMDYFTRQYLDEQAFFAMNTSEVDPWAVPDLPRAFYNSNNNWLEQTTQNPVQQQYDIFLRGGSKEINYVASLFANDSEGIVKKGYSRIYGGRVKLDAMINKYLRFRLNANGSTRKTSSKDNMLDIIKKVRPDLPMYNEDGTIFTRDSYTQNPLELLKNTNQADAQDFSGIVELEWTILPGLTLTTEGQLKYYNGETLTYDRFTQYNEAAGQSLNTRDWRATKTDTKVWNNRLSYIKTFGLHDVSGVVVYSMERYQKLYHRMFANTFPDDDVLNSFKDAAVRSAMDETYTSNSMLSLIGRFEYKYDNRYLATVTVRRDGSSRFGPDRQWGWFPSMGVGWTFSGEKFARQGWLGRNLSHGKLRASYGRAGSQVLSDYQWMTMVASNVYDGQPGIYPNNLGNPALKWEETTMFDAALELEFMDSRIRTTLGYFNKKGADLIYNQSLPPSSSFSQMTANMATTKTIGYEVNFDIDILRNERYWLTFNFNGATNKTKVIRFNNSMTEWLPANSYYKLEKGEQMGQWFGYKTHMRLLATGEELAALKGRNLQTGVLNTNYHNNYESPGDLYFQDLNGDGIVNTNDKDYLGSFIPKFFGGFGLDLRIGQSWFLGAHFTYELGHKRFWQMPYADVGYTGNYNQSAKIVGMSASNGRDPRDKHTIPNATPYGDGGSGTMFNDWWLFDASYVRLNSLSARYRFNQTVLQNTVLQNVELSLQVDNLFTLTRYPGFDPQGNFSASTSATMASSGILSSSQGIDYSYYPSARTITFGVKITF